MAASTTDLMLYVHQAQAQTTPEIPLEIPPESMEELQKVTVVLDPDGRLVGVEPVDYTRF